MGSGKMICNELANCRNESRKYLSLRVFPSMHVLLQFLVTSQTDL